MHATAESLLGHVHPAGLLRCALFNKDTLVAARVLGVGVGARTVL